jgi:hypothetical protein
MILEKPCEKLSMLKMEDKKLMGQILEKTIPIQPKSFTLKDLKKVSGVRLAIIEILKFIAHKATEI